ncbi:MAG: SGNH/GDSL hydrolase family protein [Longimicrobiales bacterium]
MKPRIAAVARGMRDGWLILGVVLLIYMSLEGLYRLQGAARTALARTESIPSAHPYRDSAWYPEYLQEHEASLVLQWKPYVYFRRLPFRGKHINVDSMRHRVTVQPAVTQGDAREIFFFGGSTMWGDYQRDVNTIPSVVAASLASAGVPVVAINFGESGYVFTQSILELIMQLRAGARPDVVVFYDGINDVAAGVQSRQGGMPQNEFNRMDEFELGRALRGNETGHSVGADLRAFTRLALKGAERSQLFKRVGRAARRPADTSGFQADSIAQRVADVYLGMVEVTEALSKQFGFKALYVWQPNLQTTRKKTSPFELSLLTNVTSTPFGQQLTALHQRLPALLGSTMAQKVAGRYADLSRLFDASDRPVYVDNIGHTTEEATREISQHIARLLLSHAFAQAGGSN